MDQRPTNSAGHEPLRVPTDPFGDGDGFWVDAATDGTALSGTRVYRQHDFCHVANDEHDNIRPAFVRRTRNDGTLESEGLGTSASSSGGRPMAMDHRHENIRASRQRGSALVPSLIVVSALATLGLAMLTTGLDGARNVNFESDDYRLTSAVESVASMAAEDLWSDYLVAEGGAAGTIASFRTYLDTLGLSDQCNGQGVTGCPTTAPAAMDGVDWSQNLSLGKANTGKSEYHDVNVDAMNIVRRDEGDATQLWFTVSASTQRGEGIVNPTLDRAIQVVYTIEPQDFDGFDYAILGNNVNCVFCHANVDSVERYFNQDPLMHNKFDRIKMGTLETLMVRTDQDNKPSVVNDFDADSRLAGTLYVRGPATDQAGAAIPDWATTTLGSYAFDPATGKLVEDPFGMLSPTAMAPGTGPLQPMENLYLDYPDVYTQMVDGSLPSVFPPPIPDDGGATGIGANNKLVDPSEFASILASSQGSVTARTVYQYNGNTIDTAPEYNAAFFTKTGGSIVGSTNQHTVLIGTKARPIRIKEQVAIDGDVVLAGYVIGEGSIVASGNIYIPSDLMYRDGQDVNGYRTFGVGYDGTSNALALAAGGNILIGDWLRPAGLREDFTFNDPAKFEIIDGTSSNKWSFSLAEMSIFNRGEWAKTQALLPGVNDDPNDPTSWSIPNPDYTKHNPPGGAPYMPRYYHYGPGDEIPIFNKGVHYDPSTKTWIGPKEVPLNWDPTQLTVLDPSNLAEPLLYDSSGNMIAAISQIEPNGGWFDNAIYKDLIEYYEDNRTWGEPFKIDGLLYTNNSIMTIVNRETTFEGQMQLNGAMVAADLGVLVPSYHSPGTAGTSANMPGSPYKVGLQLNYDNRIRNLLQIPNPYQVTIKRTLWNPTANIL